jgi:putative transposase
MIVTRGIDIRLYPNKGQAVFINKMIGGVRVMYNAVLYRKQKYYSEHKESLKIKPTDLYDEFHWMRELDSQGLCNAFQDLNKAYTNWFNSMSKKTKQCSKEPKYKAKSHSGSYRNAMCLKEVYELFRNDKICLPKLKLVSFKANIDLNRIKKIYNVTIKKTNTNKYFCSICCDYEVTKYEQTGNCIGLDLGIKDLIITSDGTKYENKKFIKNSEKKIKHLQRNYSRKEKGSKNQEKARLKLAIAHEKLGNKRKDYLQKLTTSTVKDNSIICIEDLNVKGMMKNHKLAKSIADCSFSMIRSMLDYKCRWYDRKLIVIDRWSPTSKTCSCCGHVMKDWNLGIREWTCPNCHTNHDRDINAAQNILSKGMKILDTVGTTGIHACGEDSSVVEIQSRSFVKRENQLSSAVD